jgi:hypothetical protein
MTELSKRDIEALAEQNVGHLKEVQESVCLLMAIAPALKRAQKACKTAANENAAKSASDQDDAEADATTGTMMDAHHAFRRIVAEIESLERYI